MVPARTSTPVGVCGLPRFRDAQRVVEPGEHAEIPGVTDASNSTRPDESAEGAPNRRVGEYRLDPGRAAAIRTAPPLVMDLMEASAYLVCSPGKLRDLVARGRVKHARVGAKIVIRREWLDAFLGR